MVHWGLEGERVSLSRVFVTGGSGFLGGELIAGLCGRGVAVRALARSERAAAAIAGRGGTPVRGDLDDAAAMRAGMSGCEAVFHCAAETNDWAGAAAYRTNVVGTEHALAAARAEGVRRLVHVSTESVLIGAGEAPLINADETRPRAARPLGWYARTKAMAEERVLAANGAGLEAMIVRPRFIWGVGDTTILPRLVRAVRSGGFMWFGGGRYRTSTAHVANVCEGLLCAAERGRGGEIYFVTDGETVEFRAFLTTLLRTQGVEPGGRSIPTPLAYALAAGSELVWRGLRLRGEPLLTRFRVRVIGEEVTVNDGKARRELGYRGRMTREEGLAAMRAAEGGPPPGGAER